MAPQKPPLLSEHRESKVRMLFRQKSELALGALQESLAPESPGTDGDLDWMI
jgi:hypothetical protein